MAKGSSYNKRFLVVGLPGKEVVAIYTTSGPETDRKASLQRWTKRTQEMLAFQSQQGGSFDRLYNLFRTKRLVEVALDSVLQNEGAVTAGVDGVTRKTLSGHPDRYHRLKDESGES